MPGEILLGGGLFLSSGSQLPRPESELPSPVLSMGGLLRGQALQNLPSRQIGFSSGEGAVEQRSLMLRLIGAEKAV